jgi:hypothetical protein
MRKDTWDIDLMAFIKSREKTPFQWGSQDCVLFACDCAQAMTGIDLAAKYRGYSTREEAYEIIAHAGDLRALVNSELASEISPTFARRGDFVLLDQDGVQALAICIGVMAVAAGKTGLATRRMTDAITAWRID